MVNRKEKEWKREREGEKEGEHDNYSSIHIYTRTYISNHRTKVYSHKERKTAIGGKVFLLHFFSLYIRLTIVFCFAGATTTKVRNEEKESAQREKKRKKATPNYFLTTITNEQLYTDVYIYTHIYINVCMYSFNRLFVLVSKRQIQKRSVSEV